jgi:predicted nucleotidyltransferase
MGNDDHHDAMAEIDAMVQRIVEQFNPLKVILFGSYARGAVTRDSDVDLLIVMEVNGSKRKQATQIDLALSQRELPLDLIVVSPEEFERYRDVIGHIVYPVAREGKVLYERAA